MSGIVVGVDGSADSVLALRFAIREAALRSLPLRVVSVYEIPPIPSMWGYPVPQIPAPRDDLDRIRQRTADLVSRVAREEHASLPDDLVVEAVTGQPVQGLLRHAADADLMVVGRRGLGVFSRMLLGSTSTALLHHAPCPVVVVPHAATLDGGTDEDARVSSATRS